MNVGTGWLVHNLERDRKFRESWGGGSVPL